MAPPFFIKTSPCSLDIKHNDNKIDTYSGLSMSVWNRNKYVDLTGSSDEQEKETMAQHQERNRDAAPSGASLIRVHPTSAKRKSTNGDNPRMTGLVDLTLDSSDEEEATLMADQQANRQPPVAAIPSSIVNEKLARSEATGGVGPALEKQTSQSLTSSRVLDQRKIPSRTKPPAYQQKNKKRRYVKTQNNKSSSPTAATMPTSLTEGILSAATSGSGGPGSKVFALEHSPSWMNSVPQDEKLIQPPETDDLLLSQYAPEVKTRPQRTRRGKRKRKASGAHVEDVDNAPRFAVEGYMSTLENKVADKKMPKETIKEPQFRHVLLGNSNIKASHQLDEEKENDAFLYFIPDCMEELHDKLTKVEQEYAWLLEESHHLYRHTDPTFIYQYASPYLKIMLRSKAIKSDDDAIIPLEKQATFAVKRRDVAQKLRQGHRRGPIMSRVLATLRFQSRRVNATTKRLALSTISSRRLDTNGSEPRTKARATNQNGPSSRSGDARTPQKNRKSSPTKEHSATARTAGLVVRKSSNLLIKSARVPLSPFKSSKPVLSSVMHHNDPATQVRIVDNDSHPKRVARIDNPLIEAELGSSSHHLTETAALQAPINRDPNKDQVCLTCYQQRTGGKPYKKGHAKFCEKSIYFGQRKYGAAAAKESVRIPSKPLSVCLPTLWN
jgi:hypothetical protein